MNEQLNWPEAFSIVGALLAAAVGIVGMFWAVAYMQVNAIRSLQKDEWKFEVSETTEPTVNRTRADQERSDGAGA